MPLVGQRVFEALFAELGQAVQHAFLCAGKRIKKGGLIRITLAQRGGNAAGPELFGPQG